MAPVTQSSVYSIFNGEAVEQGIGVVLENKRGPMAKMARNSKGLEMEI